MAESKRKLRVGPDLNEKKVFNHRNVSHLKPIAIASPHFIVVIGPSA